MGVFEEARYQMELMELMDYVLKGITQLGMPGDGKFDYATDKKRTKHATDMMVQAEENLDYFWSMYDASWKRLTRKSVEASMGHHGPYNRGEFKGICAAFSKGQIQKQNFETWITGSHYTMPHGIMSCCNPIFECLPIIS